MLEGDDMNNLDHFNNITANVLSACFEQFPVPRDFHYENFYPENEENHDHDISDVFYHTMMWLRKYEYIDFWDTDLSGTSFQHVSLTEKSLNILNKIPESLEEKTSIGRQLGRILKDGATNAASDMIKSILSIGYSSGLEVLTG